MTEKMLKIIMDIIKNDPKEFIKSSESFTVKGWKLWFWDENKKLHGTLDFDENTIRDLLERGLTISIEPEFVFDCCLGTALWFDGELGSCEEPHEAETIEIKFHKGELSIHFD